MIQISDLIEITLQKPDDFLKVKETLSRMGVASKQEKTLYQSAHILHKKGKYYIVHFKQLFMLDGKPSNFDQDDQARLNTIANLLHDWELVDLVEPEKTEEPTCPIGFLTIIPFAEKQNWKLVTKYTIGKKKVEQQ